MDDVDRKHIKDQMVQNKHEAYVLDLEELDQVVRIGFASPAKVNQRQAWDVLRGKLSTIANHTASIQDLSKLAKIFADLGFAGTKAYVKYHAGKAYIIFKGNPRLRSIFTGTRYGLHNAKVVQMGLGAQGAMRAVKSGGILTVILVGAFRILDYILTDQTTMNQLVGTLATDVIKIGLATGAAIVAGAAFGAVFTVAVGPLVAAIAVGALVAYGLDKLDAHYALTERVIAALDELETGIEQVIRQKKQQALAAVNTIANSAIDYAVYEARRIAINAARHYMGKALPRW